MAASAIPVARRQSPRVHAMAVFRSRGAIEMASCPAAHHITMHHDQDFGLCRFERARHEGEVPQVQNLVGSYNSWCPRAARASRGCRRGVRHRKVTTQCRMYVQVFSVGCLGDVVSHTRHEASQTGRGPYSQVCLYKRWLKFTRPKARIASIRSSPLICECAEYHFKVLAMYEGTCTKCSHGITVESAPQADRFMSSWHQRWSVFRLRYLELSFGPCAWCWTDKHPWRSWLSAICCQPHCLTCALLLHLCI